MKKVYSVEVSDSSPLQHLHHVLHNPYPLPPPSPLAPTPPVAALNPAHRHQTQRSKSSLLVLSDGQFMPKSSLIYT